MVSPSVVSAARPPPQFLHTDDVDRGDERVTAKSFMYHGPANWARLFMQTRRTPGT